MVTSEVGPGISGAIQTQGGSSKTDNPPALIPTQLSRTVPSRLVQFTGNLYWTNNLYLVDFVSGSWIFRASKSSQPGEEISLYTEAGQPGETNGFGALACAEVDGEFYAYFAANYPNVSQIKRIPLVDVPELVQADVLADSPAAISTGDLVTDGSFLCWADSQGIRSMPIGGGPVTTLAEGTGFAHLSVLGGTLYYIDGNTIYSVPTGGGTPSFVLGTRLFPITALYVLEEPPPVALAERPEKPEPPPVSDVALVWGRADGGVFGMVRGETTTYQESAADTTVICVYSTGTRVLWSQQYFGQEGVQYQLLMSYGGVTTTLSSEIAYLSNRDLLADEVAAYWTDAYVEKYTF